MRQADDRGYPQRWGVEMPRWCDRGDRRLVRFRAFQFALRTE